MPLKRRAIRASFISQARLAETQGIAYWRYKKRDE
jgi:hypothetical protein